MRKEVECMLGHDVSNEGHDGASWEEDPLGPIVYQWGHTTF